MKRQTVRTIVEGWLREHGYDGLCDLDCGCSVEDLMLCDSGQQCEPGYKVPCDCDGECDGERWHIYAGDIVSPEHPAMAEEAELECSDNCARLGTADLCAMCRRAIQGVTE